VATRRLALAPLPCRVLVDRIHLAADRQQPIVRLLLCQGSVSILMRWHDSLAMSDELAQDEPDAEDYDMANLEQRVGQPRGPAHPDDDDEEDDAATLVGGRRGASVRDETVFEIGDEDGDEEEERKRLRRLSGEGERQGLMGRKDE
jgi:hypothetical protein